eukprot:4718232-Prymnesium_polylepis.1
MSTRTGEAVVVDDALLDDRFELRGGAKGERLACLSQLCIPVHANRLSTSQLLDSKLAELAAKGSARTAASNAPVGVICAINKTNHARSASGLRFTDFDTAAGALAAQIMFDTVEKLAAGSSSEPTEGELRL